MPADVTILEQGSPKSTVEPGIRVLVLDDQEDIRSLFTKVLRRSGCKVETAESGHDGLQLLLEQSFDVLVVDVFMEEMDGPTFIQEALKIWPWLGVVVVSGAGNEQLLARLGDLEVAQILTKPVPFGALKEAVQREAADRRDRLERSPGIHPEQMRYQLSLLRHVTEQALANRDLNESLEALARGLARQFEDSVVGIFSTLEDEAFVVVQSDSPVNPSYLDVLRGELVQRFNALSGDVIDAGEVALKTDDLDLDAGAVAAPATTLIVPVITLGELHGLLIIGTPAADAFSAGDTNFLYFAANQISTLSTAIQRINEQAITDSLTGVFNRRLLDEELERSWERSRRYGTSMSVAVVDLDGFKRVNDEFGHQAGDDVLRDLARLVRDATRKTDVVGRYGGDELVVLLPEGGAVAARTFAERLLASVRSYVFCRPETPLSLSVSIGIAHSDCIASPDCGAAVFALADQALYSAKRAGRDRVVVWTPELKEENNRNEGGDASKHEPIDATPTRVLVVDDNTGVLRVIGRVLRMEDYTVTTAECGEDALQLMAESDDGFDVLLTDLNMPGISGVQLLNAVSEIDPHMVKLVTTGDATVDGAIECMRRGAYDFVHKPVTRDQLTLAVKRAADYHRVIRENQRYRMYLEERVEERSRQLTQTLEALADSYDFTLEAMVALLDAREQATGQHTRRVRELAVALADMRSLPAAQTEVIGRGALLHDIGKMAIPDEVLLKPGKFTDDELEIMRGHAEIGYRVLSGSEAMVPAAEIVYSHHERYDGQGYPRGLKGEEICLGARIFSIVDAYDAMRSNRPYRASMPVEEAAAEIWSGSGTQFDPSLVDLFLRHIDSMESIGKWDEDAG